MGHAVGAVVKPPSALRGPERRTENFWAIFYQHLSGVCVAHRLWGMRTGRGQHQETRGKAAAKAQGRGEGGWDPRGTVEVLLGGGRILDAFWK